MNHSIDAFYNEKIIDPAHIEEVVTAARAEGKTVATLNGSFDLLHAGHLHIIYSASQAADILVMALNSDRSIKEYKSASRPIIPLKHRLEMISALSFVDYVTWFDEVDPINILGMIRPDVHVNGAEYGHDCIEKEIVEKHGGTIQVVSLVDGLSTSAIVKKVQTLCD